MSMPFVHVHRVTYAECTVGNHLYYARYLDLWEAARGALFRAAGSTFAHWQSEGVIFPVIGASLEYAGAARYDDEVRVEITVTKVHRVRLEFGYRVVGSSGKVLARGVTRHVCTDLADKPRRLPGALVAALVPWTAEGDDGAGSKN
jgi:acyl-CoA thioester hydrolase